MSKPLILDLFCGAGGAAEGYVRAGFEVVGIDNKPMPRYQHEFRQGDALNAMRCMRRGGEWQGLRLDMFDAIHASPPCQAFSTLAYGRPASAVGARLLPDTRRALVVSGLPWVIENVENAPMRRPIKLCGTMFPGLRVIRHRCFESSVPLEAPPHEPIWEHPKVIQRAADLVPGESWLTVAGNFPAPREEACAAMGIDWTMTREEVAEAIPPAYTELIGPQLIA